MPILSISVQLSKKQLQLHLTLLNLRQISLLVNELTSGNAIDAGAVTGANAGKLTFDVINDAMQAAWSRGGSIDFAVMSGKNKRVCSGFTQVLLKTVNKLLKNW